jgi:ankyrin repeat protein
MPKLPIRPDLDQLRHQAKDLLRAARTGDHPAIARVGTAPTLARAQLAIARDYGFASWSKLKTEVERRVILDSRDAGRLRALIARQPKLATDEMLNWCDHQNGAAPLSYVAMMRFETSGGGIWRDLPGTGELARLLLAAGAPVDGDPQDDETPLMTAASYGDAEVARVLIQAGASLEAASSAGAGGVPNATALRHAAVFGMTDVLDVLLAAGAQVVGLSQAAAAGDVGGWLRPDTSLTDRVLALAMAADHQRLSVIDVLLDAGTPIDAEDEVWGRQALRLAASNGRARSVRHLLARGADPNHRDPEQGLTALEWCRRKRSGVADGSGHTEAEALLVPVTSG